MPRIHRLSPDPRIRLPPAKSSNRPASVVKELVENALDAGARRIVVAVELGGKKLIRVEDDGEGWNRRTRGWRWSGMPRARSRHADDLGAIRTLGFRGEALPSIASVSHFVLRTRARGATNGTEIRVTGGAIAAVREVGMPQGTSIEVADPFYNLPARRKFLKSDTAETTQTSRLATQMALGYPEVGITLTSGGRTLLECPPAADCPNGSSSCSATGRTWWRFARKRAVWRSKGMWPDWVTRVPSAVPKTCSSIGES